VPGAVISVNVDFPYAGLIDRGTRAGLVENDVVLNTDAEAGIRRQELLRLRLFQGGEATAPEALTGTGRGSAQLPRPASFSLPDDDR